MKDIRWWIFFFFLVRLVGVAQAPLEAGHNWRQSLTNMIARNFLQEGPNLFFPMIDMAGNKTGIIGSEFPFLNFLIYCVAYLLGWDHWYGRLINLTVSSVGLYYFYRLIRAFFTKQVAFHATMVLMLSIWFTFSRKIMPDTFSVSLMLIGLFYGIEYARTSKIWRLVLFCTFCTLGMLCKIPTLSLFCGIAVLVWVKEIPFQRKAILLAFGGVSFLTACAWYFYWVPHLVEAYDFPLYFPNTFPEGIQKIAPLLPQYLEKFYFSALHSYVAFTCALAGWILLCKKRDRLLLITVGLITLVFIAFTIKTGEIFPTHNYYVIPYVPVMALGAGYFIAQIPRPYQYFLLLIIAAESIANQQHDFFIKEDRRYKLRLEAIVNNYIPEKALVVINGGQSPQSIYFANRKGWTVNNEQITNSHYLQSLSDRGARYLIIDRSADPLLQVPYRPIYKGPHYGIYALAPSE